MALIALGTDIKNKIQTWNLFENVEKTEEEDLRNQHIATWTFMILLSLSVFALLFYASLTTVTNTVVVQQPSVEVYKKLQLEYPNTLVCPCQQILNEYSTFIVSFTARYNQICTSDFVNESWLNYVNYRLLPQIQYHFKLDFRHSAYAFFQMLRTLCTSVSQTINDQLGKFDSTVLLTENLLSEEAFSAIILASKDQFISTMSRSFQTSLNSLSIIIHGNGIVNRLETNYNLRTIQFQGTWYSVSGFVVYPSDNCTCAASTGCRITTGIFAVLPKGNSSDRAVYYDSSIINALYEPKRLFDVPGINVGCLIFDAVLRSNLSCLYSSSCLSELKTYLNDSLYPFNAKPLSISDPSLPTVSEMVGKLMVDEWLFNSSYEFYFSQCKPLTCTYTYAKQFEVVFIVTTMLGTVDVIVTLLMLVVLPIMIYVRRLARCQQRPLISQTEIG